MERTVVQEYIQAFFVAIILALFVIAFIAQSFHVQGRSMEPTLYHGQRLLVDKLTYRFLTPSMGDVVIFRYPTDTRRKFIKRIIGLPGDEIAIRNGMVYKNGAVLGESYVSGPTLGPYNAPSFGPVRVPDDHYFVLGDNRRNSDDSRYPDVGFIPTEYVVGRALLTYWPLNAVALHRTPTTLR